MGLSSKRKAGMSLTSSMIGLKPHLVEDIFLEVDAGCDFCRMDVVFLHFEYGTFRNVQDMLFMFPGIVCR